MNAMGWRLEKPGRYSLESIHPYGLKTAHLIVEEGEVEVLGFKVRSYLNSDVGRASFRCSDPGLELIFSAAKQSLACNAVDIFTDCPGRERGAYFGDTVFTGRGADALLGECAFERVLYENYALAPKFRDVPDGMIPMCYPADVTLDSAHWIPNFCLWSVIELADYLKRSGDRALADRFRSRAEGILAWFRRSRNEMGLLENLPGWVFVEWSDASRFVNGISFATNMTYIRFLDAFAELYGDAGCAREAERLRAVVRRLSWRGEWFCDNAVRNAAGELEFSGESTELNQYLAFFSGVATRERDAGLWRRVLELGPMRKKGLYPKLWPSNLLFGYSLRFVLLSEAGESARVLEETRHLYLPMAKKTGTLWESVGTAGYSCCHGFPSMAAWQLMRDALGLKEIRRGEKKVRIEIPDGVRLEWCEGEIPVSASESVKISWRRRGKERDVAVELPAGWTR
jgi:alpha-L-rhamnosidase